jgi:glutathione synthase/RimK-type ligase-like ATP-grasp enzyme
MNNRDIIILTGDKKFYGQTRKAWVSMNADHIENRLKSLGCSVKQLNIQQVFNKNISLSGHTILYSFSQKENVRHYIRDIAFHLNKTNRLIPCIDLLFCHENKGYQELYKRDRGLTGLKAWYFSSLEDIDTYDIPYPVVLKTVSGSNGKGVFLVRDRKALEKRVHTLTHLNVWTKLDLIRRRYFRKRTYPDYPNHDDYQDYLQYKEYITKHQNFILQEFIPNLTYDTRVLALEGKFFVTRRHTRKNDFRASGTKKYDFDFTPENDLLVYAEKTARLLNSPFLSMDIVHDGKNYYLIEFQASHFGVSAITKSRGYYIREGSRWKFRGNNQEVEVEIADALDRYLKRTAE